MSDELARSEETEERQEAETETEVEETEAEVEETESEDGTDPESGDPEGERDPDERTNDERGERREARGRPDARHRERRERRERDREFDEAVERAVERKLGQVGVNRGPDPAEQQRQRQARRQQEIEEARVAGNVAEVLDRHQREDFTAAIQARDLERADQRNQDQFDRLCDRNPIYDRIRDDVEDRVSQLRARGVAAPDRKLIANVILGERYAERANSEGKRQRRDADRETRRQSVRAPGRFASDQPASRRRGGRDFASLSVEEQEQILAQVPLRSSN